MPIYRRRVDIPAVVEAIEFTGRNHKEVIDFWPRCIKAWRRLEGDPHECIYVPDVYKGRCPISGDFLMECQYLVKNNSGGVDIVDSSIFEAQYGKKFVETEREA